MHALCLSQALDLVGNSVVWVVAEIGRDFIGGCQDGGAGPAGDVEDFLVGCLLGHLDWVNGSHCLLLASALIDRGLAGGVREAYLCGLVFPPLHAA